MIFSGVFSQVTELMSRYSSVFAPEGLTMPAYRRMLAEERQITLKNQLLIAMLIVILVPIFSILDYFCYPEFFGIFLILRLLCVGVTLIVMALMRSSKGKRYYRGFTLVLPLIPAFFISLMILYSQDPATPYYAGLTLCIVAIGFVFHWTYQEAFFASLLIALMYLVASAPAVFNGMDARTAAGFANNSIFIAAKGIVIVLGCHAHHLFRVQNHILREKARRQKVRLAKQKQQLENTLEELRDTENELIQSEKMASLGQLSAGVIHEIGNPLNYSNQALFLLRRVMKNENRNPAVDEAIDDIQDSIDRMKDIVKELREFSHKSGEIHIEFEIEESIEAGLRMLKKEIEDSGIEVVENFKSGIRVEGVKNQLTQVVINLVHNSIQALEQSKERDDRRIEIETAEKDQFVDILIRDNGPGVDQKLQSYIFDPFFTTKEAGDGTGLGLSICFRIIEGHRGTITFDSKPDQYTEFRIRLPRTPGDLAQANQQLETSHHQTPNPQNEHAIS